MSIDIALKAFDRAYVCEYCKRAWDNDEAAAACENYHKERRDAYWWSLATYAEAPLRMMWEVSMKLTPPSPLVMLSSK